MAHGAVSRGHDRVVLHDLALKRHAYPRRGALGFNEWNQPRSNCASPGAEKEKTSVRRLSLLATACGLLLFALPAQAQLNETDTLGDSACRPDRSRSQGFMPPSSNRF